MMITKTKSKKLDLEDYIQRIQLLSDSAVKDIRSQYESLNWVCKDGLPFTVGDELYGEDGVKWKVIHFDPSNPSHPVFAMSVNRENASIADPVDHTYRELKPQWLSHNDPTCKETADVNVESSSDVVIRFGDVPVDNLAYIKRSTLDSLGKVVLENSFDLVSNCCDSDHEYRLSEDDVRVCKEYIATLIMSLSNLLAYMDNSGTDVIDVRNVIKLYTHPDVDDDSRESCRNP